MKGIGYSSITKKFYYINGKKKDDVTEYINQIIFKVTDRLVKENTELKLEVAELKKKLGSKEG